MSTVGSNVLKGFGVGSLCAIGGFALLTTAVFLLITYLGDTLANDALVVCGRAAIWGALAVTAYASGYCFGPNKAAAMVASVVTAFLLMLFMTSLGGAVLLVRLTVAVVVGLLAGLAASWRAGVSQAYASDGGLRFRRIFTAGMASVILCWAGLNAWAVLILQPVNRQISTHNRLLNVGVACNFYMVQEGDSPESVTDLFQSPVRRNVYLQPWAAKDGWGHPIQIRAFDVSRGHGSVISYGRDGRAGGEGPDADTAVPFAAISQ